LTLNSNKNKHSIIITEKQRRSTSWGRRQYAFMSLAR